MIANVSNEAKMIGVLPVQGANPIPVGKIPDDGIQIAKSVTATNETLLLLTITAGRTFYLTHYVFTPNSSVVGAYGRVAVRNGSDVEQYVIAMTAFDTVGQVTVSGTLNPPLEIAAGWDIIVVSSDADLNARAFIHGYEV